jgi:tetratricopeptide (TPR) repeat protein
MPTGPTSTAVGTQATFTATVTAIGGRPPTQAVGTPGVESLAERFNVSYTATPLYAPLERSPLTSDLLIPFESAFAQGKWDDAIEALMNALQADPDAVSIYYYLGETHRLKGEFGNALGYYNEAINRDETYGPAHLGLARTRLQLDPNANVLPLLNQAIQYSPDFGEAYIERARVKIRDNDIQGAVSDLGEANELLSDSPLVFHYLAQARVREGDYELALIAAQRANELDLTHLPTYLLLGQIHAELENDEEAVEFLNLYLEYEPRDLAAQLLSARLHFGLQDYEATIRTMGAALALNSDTERGIFISLPVERRAGQGGRGGGGPRTVLDLYPESFEANLAILRLHLLQERDDPPSTPSNRSCPWRRQKSRRRSPITGARSCTNSSTSLIRRSNIGNSCSTCRGMP